jgi:hypothetical protein
MKDPSNPNRSLERLAGGASLLAGGIHGLVTPDHFAAWWGYGAFFLIAAMAQLVFGLLLVTNGINATDTGPNWRVWKRRAYILGLVGNLLIIGLYLVTRTSGIPVFGPEAGAVEEVGVLDVVSKIAELVVVVALAKLLTGRSFPA